MFNKAHKRHEKVVASLEQRILNSDKYQQIVLHREYGKEHILGELDIFAKRKNSNRVVYFECKGNYNNASYRKAKKQFQRFYDNFSDQYDCVFVYVTPQLTKRIYLHNGENDKNTI